MDARTPALSRREAGKADRRRRIVEAAAALVREAGLEGVSMVQIAEAAGVVPATLYNLFQTKAAIFGQVFDLDLQEYRRQLDETPGQDSLGRIFAAVDLAASLYRRDPAFYRAMARGGGLGVEFATTAISEPRIAFWREQVARAIETGQLRNGASADLLGVTLSHVLRGAFLEWAAGVISADRMAKEGAYGVALTLLGYASPDATRALKARLRDLEFSLSARPRGERG
jgi:AcrR family transcriptional regulator